METQQMSQDPVQELKAERVQEEIAFDLFQIVPEEPFRIWLKRSGFRSRRLSWPVREGRSLSRTRCRSTR